MRVRGSKKPKASETKTMNAAELSATFDRALAMLGGGALMSSADRQRGLKFPAGGERIAELLLQVAEQHGVTPPPHSKIDPEDIRARLRAAAELRPVVARAAVVEAALSDRLRTNERAAWEPTLALYRLLQALAVSDAGIELSLAPIQELFATRKVRKTESSPDAEEVTIDKTG